MRRGDKLVASQQLTMFPEVSWDMVGSGRGMDADGHEW